MEKLYLIHKSSIGLVKRKEKNQLNDMQWKFLMLQNPRQMKLIHMLKMLFYHLEKTYIN